MEKSHYDDFPMPADYPDYPSHRQMLAYFQDYAQHFGVMPFIRFNTEVVKAEEQPDKTWRIQLSDGTVETFDYLMVANGHHWDPRWPNYPGQFAGRYLHSHEYKCAEPFRNQRVLIIGGGNSACDIAVETGRLSAFTAISMRRGYYVIPKFMMGQPVYVMNAKFLWLPDRLRLPLLRLALWFSVGDYASYGLERPKHGLLQQHLTAKCIRAAMLHASTGGTPSKSSITNTCGRCRRKFPRTRLLGAVKMQRGQFNRVTPLFDSEPTHSAVS